MYAADIVRNISMYQGYVWNLGLCVLTRIHRVVQVYSNFTIGYHKILYMYLNVDISEELFEKILS